MIPLRPLNRYQQVNETNSLCLILQQAWNSYCSFMEGKSLYVFTAIFLHGCRLPPRSRWEPRSLGRTGCPETSVRNYHYSLRNDPEERGSLSLSLSLLQLRNRWPCGLRRRSVAAWFLRLWVRIHPSAWMFVCCVCFAVYLAVSETSRSLVQRRPTWCLCLIVCDVEISTMRRPRHDLSCCTTERKYGCETWFVTLRKGRGLEIVFTLLLDSYARN